MQLIEPKCSYTTTENHLIYLSLIKKCVDNAIGEKYVLSKKLFDKKHKQNNQIVNKKEELQPVIDNIIYSINYYSKLT